MSWHVGFCVIKTYVYLCVIPTFQCVVLWLCMPLYAQCVVTCCCTSIIMCRHCPILSIHHCSVLYKQQDEKDQGLKLWKMEWEIYAYSTFRPIQNNFELTFPRSLFTSCTVHAQCISVTSVCCPHFHGMYS